MQMIFIVIAIMSILVAVGISFLTEMKPTKRESRKLVEVQQTLDTQNQYRRDVGAVKSIPITMMGNQTVTLELSNALASQITPR